MTPRKQTMEQKAQARLRSIARREVRKDVRSAARRAMTAARR